MPDHRQHRGRNPDDDRLFDRPHWPRLREAVTDLSWLLSRDYAAPSALKLVGDRYGLEQRQRIAVARCACSDRACEIRRCRQMDVSAVRGHCLAIDGFNVITTLEAALGGGVLLRARDSCLRDMASVHGTYRKVVETLPAIELIVRSLTSWRASCCIWYLDRPVSNSGRLAKLLKTSGTAHGLDWQVELVDNPDRELREQDAVIATADSVILDNCRRWINFTTHVLQEQEIDISAIDLSDSSDAGCQRALKCSHYGRFEKQPF